MIYRIFFLFILFIGFQSNISIAQLSLETFGKNRVQRVKFEWRYYESNRFRVYYYNRGGAELAKYVSEQADQDVKAIERTLNNNFPDMLNIIVFNNYDDYLQTNIDFQTELEVSDPYAGKIKIAGDRLVIYFTGKHSDLKRQLRRGMAQVIMERSLMGDDVKSYARNILTQKIPSWVSEGYIDYSVFGWDSESEELWKQMLKPTKVHFERLAEKDEIIAGRAFWKYINDRYGSEEVRNLFFFILQKNNLNTALKQKFNIPLKHFNDSLVNFYKARYEFESKLTDDPLKDSALFIIKRPNDDVKIRDVKVSPRGSDVAYVEWANGEYKVVLEKTYNQKETKFGTKGVVLKGGNKDFTAESDINYPLIAWSNTGFKLGIIYPKYGKLYIRIYDAVGAKHTTHEIKYNRFERVQGFTFTDDDNFLILSAIRNGQSDLFEYKYRTGQFTQLTDDTYDDQSPIYIAGGARKGIAFLSNRPLPILNMRALPNELPTHPMNAFFYYHEIKNNNLLQLSKEKEDRVTQIVPYGQDYYSYLSDKSGIKNRYVVLFGRAENNMDTAYSVPVTNYSSNILFQQYNAASSKMAEVIQESNAYKVYFREIVIPAPAGPGEIKEPIYIRSVEEDKKQGSQTGMQKVSENKIVLNDQEDFISEFSYSTSTSDTMSKNISLQAESVDFAEKMSLKKVDSSMIDTSIKYTISNENLIDGKRILYVDSSYIKMRSNKYHRAFHIASFSAHLDNSLIFTKYQSYGGNFGMLNTPNLGGMFTVVLKDRMEDHRITGGLRFNNDFTASYLVKYENLKRRLDWGITGFIHNTKFITNVGLTNGITVTPYEIPTKGRLSIIQAQFNYPFTRTSALRAQIGLRQDRSTLQASELVGLLVPDMSEHYSMNRFEWVYDNTDVKALNIMRGLRSKVFGEFMYKFHSENEFHTDANGVINNKLGGFYNLGFDIRYYKPIYRNVTFAVRGAGAHSGGNQQIMYSLGGVDNEISPQYNNLMTPTLQNSYAFSSLATNLRGYQQNSRNGNTYAVMNAELRMPVYSTLFNTPAPNLFMKNLQLVAFVDAGSAWEGLLPDNKLQRNNTFYYPDKFNPTTVVTIPMPEANLICVGYGIGARLYMYSYFVRVDYARNIDNGSMIHVSLGYDF